MTLHCLVCDSPRVVIGQDHTVDTANASCQRCGFTWWLLPVEVPTEVTK